jgi:hypothetical protein
MTETTWGIRFNEYPSYQRVPKGQKQKDVRNGLPPTKSPFGKSKG